MIDLSAAQAALSAVLHTTPCTILRVTRVIVAGVAVATETAIAETACHLVHRSGLHLAPDREQDLGAPVLFGVSLPIATDVQPGDVIVVQLRRYRVIDAPPVPQFSLDLFVRAADIV